MTENEAASAEVLIWTGSPMIIPQPTTPLLPPLLLCVRVQTGTNVIHGGFPLHATAWFLAVALLHEADMSRGDPQQLVQLFICLSIAYRRSSVILQRACIDGDIVPE